MAVNEVEAAVWQEEADNTPRVMKGADILWESIVREGVEVIFGYPGGAVLTIYHSLPNYPLRHVLVRHEQAAAHAADGYARVTGRVGVCVATSGPGATNLVTGIATAYLDSSPMVALTGQVAIPWLGKDAFQEVDMISITRAITKQGFLVRRPEDIADTIKKAFYVASSGRPGPVVVDLPKDVMAAEGLYLPNGTAHPRDYSPVMLANLHQVKEVARLLNEAKHPVIIAGGGVLRSNASTELLKLAETTDVPVATTLMGKGSMPESHRLSLGMAGMHGTLQANKAIRQCDLLLAFGMRFSDRVTGKITDFAPHAKIVHVDIDPKEIGKNVRVDVAVVADVKEVLGLMLREVATADHNAWQSQVSKWRSHYHPKEHVAPTSVSPRHVIETIQKTTGGQAIMVTDVGQNQMWTAQFYQYDKPDSLVSSGGLGTMGFGLPAAMGAKVGCPDRPVWCVAGDGGFQMTLQELATLTQDNIPVKTAILNNGYLGMVRQWQEFFYDHRYSASAISGPDFVAVCQGYGVQARRVTSNSDVEEAVRWANEVDGPVVLEFVIEPEANVFPMIPAGATVNDTIETGQGMVG